MPHMIATFAHGNGPYARTMDLGIAINDELEGRGEGRLPIIMPLVYGDRQIRIMGEEIEALGKSPNKMWDEILLDEFYGGILKELFFKAGHYQENLELLLEKQPALEEKLRDYLAGTLEVKTLDGQERRVEGREVEFEISHNPRVATGYKNSFYTTIGFFSEILWSAASEARAGNLDFNPELLDEVKIKIANKIEEDKTHHFMPEPFVFSYRPRRQRWREEIFTPPFIHIPNPNNEQVPKGMYVMPTGIEGLQGLFDSVDKFGMKLYCPPFGPIEGADNTHTPEFVANPNIKYQFARTGWSSVWLSHMSETPLIAPAYTQGDDPEIYFNEKSVQALGLAAIFDGKKDPREVLVKTDSLRPRIQEVNQKLRINYGTLDGMNYTARAIVDYLINADVSRYEEKEPVLNPK